VYTIQIARLYGFNFFYTHTDYQILFYYGAIKKTGKRAFSVENAAKNIPPAVVNYIMDYAPLLLKRQMGDRVIW